jgi:hypothetical protein
MKPTLYLETTIVSYLVARPSDNLIVAAEQELTRQWWERRLKDFRVFVSQFVLDEAADGEPLMARRRKQVLLRFPLLEITNDGLILGRHLLATRLFPRGAARDASHLSVAAVHGVHFLLTWNCKHLANATVFESVREVCRKHGFVCPIVCTPLELMERI